MDRLQHGAAVEEDGRYGCNDQPGACPDTEGARQNLLKRAFHPPDCGHSRGRSRVKAFHVISGKTDARGLSARKRLHRPSLTHWGKGMRSMLLALLGDPPRALPERR